MAAQLALKMNIGLQQDEEPSTMVDEYAYMDAMHTREKGYKTLTLWTYHHGMRCVMCLATMEAERENTECFTLFLTLWNNLLEEVSGIPGYKFNPRGIMCDEAFHFKNCTKNQLKHINIHEQQTFKELCGKLCYTYTKHEYTNVSNELENLCQQNDIENWWSWWAVRCFHIVPVFHGFNISGLNLAETGHSMIKRRCLMPLTIAAWKDICLMMLQDCNYEAHIFNTTKVSGKGMNLKQKTEQ